MLEGHNNASVAPSSTSNAGEVQAMNKTTPAATCMPYDLHSFDAFLLDMDGVLHNNGIAIAGASEFVHYLMKAQYPFVIITNECRYSNEQLSEKLGKILALSSPPPPCNIHTAANSIEDFLFRELQRKNISAASSPTHNRSAYVIGSDYLIAAVRNVFQSMLHTTVYSHLEEVSNSDVIAFVIVGTVNEENTRHKERAVEYVCAGAKLIQTCPDYYDMYEDGRFCFGSPGPTIDCICKVTGCTSYNTGKPNPCMLRGALKKLQKNSSVTINCDNILLLGDSLGTDIRTGVENGVPCGLLLTGRTSIDSLSKSSFQPDYIFNTLYEVESLHRSSKDPIPSTS